MPSIEILQMRNCIHIIVILHLHLELIFKSVSLKMLGLKLVKLGCISDSNEIRTYNLLVRKRTLNHLAKLASLAKWLSVCLQTKWLWVRILFLSLKLQIGRLLLAMSSLTFRQTVECGFTLKLVRDMIITYSHWIV